MHITNRANLTPDIHAALECDLPNFGTLAQFVAWGRMQSPPAILVESVAQDEYTHDVIASLRDNLVLVFGST